METIGTWWMWAGFLGVTIPLWFIQKQAFGVREMKLELDEVRAERRMKEQSVALDIRDSLARATANWKLLRLYDGPFIPQAEATVRAACEQAHHAQQNQGQQHNDADANERVAPKKGGGR